MTRESEAVMTLKQYDLTFSQNESIDTTLNFYKKEDLLTTISHLLDLGVSEIYICQENQINLIWETSKV